MKYLKLFESDKDDLLNSLNDLSHSMSRLKSYAKFQNRKRLRNTEKPSLLPDEFIVYFADLIQDEGWVYSINNTDFATYIRLTKVIKKEGIEQEFENIVDRMTETRDRLGDQGFQSKFIIYFNNKAQQVQNPNSYSIPLYQFTGVGENIPIYNSAYSTDPNQYSRDEYIFAKIEFAIV